MAPHAPCWVRQRLFVPRRCVTSEDRLDGWPLPWVTPIGEATMAPSPALDRESLAVARLSHGIGAAAVYERIAEVIAARYEGAGLLVDVGCGAGNLWRTVGAQFSHYVGV